MIKLYDKSATYLKLIEDGRHIDLIACDGEGNKVKSGYILTITDTGELIRHGWVNKKIGLKLTSKGRISLGDYDTEKALICNESVEKEKLFNEMLEELKEYAYNKLEHTDTCYYRESAIASLHSCSCYIKHVIALITRAEKKVEE